MISIKQKITFAKRWGLTSSHARLLARLHTPPYVQDFVASLPANYEQNEETCFSVAEVLRQNRAHCIEGAFLAAFALWMAGRPPLLLDLKARGGDTDHVVALFKEGGYWGAISKSNHVWLRWRDPVYRTVRELALSYFHEYTMEGKTKTLWSYSSPFDLRKVKTEDWVCGRDSCWDIAIALDDSRHFALFDKKQIRHLRARDTLELKAHKLIEHPRRKL